MEPAWADRSYLLAPIIPSVYRVRDASGTVIYVGQTITTVEERFSGHRYKAPWWDQAASIEVLPVPPPGDVRAVEAGEIHRWHPAHNTYCTLCTAERWAVVAAGRAERAEQQRALLAAERAERAARREAAAAATAAAERAKRQRATTYRSLSGAVFRLVYPDSSSVPYDASWSLRGPAPRTRKPGESA